MPRYLIVNGWIPDTPLNRQISEFIEVAGTIYLSGQLDQPPMTQALIGGAGYVTYDYWIRGKLGN